MSNVLISRFPGLLIAALMLLGVAAPAAGNDNPHVIVLGRISDNPRAHYQQLKPLLDYVVAHMRDVGITEGRILMARDAQQMGSYLRRGRVDWVTETAATAVALEQRAGASPLLLTERDGVSHYHSLFFVRRDSGIRALEDLRGRSVAFQNLFSTSAYYLPAIELLDHGLPLEILLSPMDKPVTGSVGYLFARSEFNISTWVHKRLIDAGTMSNIDWDNPQRLPEAYRRDLVVIHKSRDYPRAIEMVRGDLDARVRARLRQVLIQAADDPDAREAMLRFFKTTRFLPIDDEAEASLKYLRQAATRVRNQVE